MTYDPKEALYTRARAEVALVAAMGCLIVAAGIVLVFADTVLGPKRFALGIVGAMLVLPALLLKGVLAEKRTAGIAVSTLACAVGGYLGTGSWRLALITTAIGAAAGYAFYRIRSNTSYRPRLRGE